MKRLLTAAFSALLLTAAAPKPEQMPAFSATGTMHTTMQMQFPAATGSPAPGKTPAPAQTAAAAAAKNISVDMQMQVMHRQNLWRIDVAKINLATDDPTASSMAQLLPKGTISVAIDQNKRVMSMWTAGRKKYWQTKLTLQNLTKSKTTTTSDVTWDNFLKTLKSLTQYDVFNYSVSLTGHQPINGRTASVYHMALQMQKHGDKEQDLAGDTAFADDLSGVPIHVALKFDGGLTGSMAMDLTNVSTTAPASTLFTPPAGYTKAKDVTELFM